MGKLVDGDYKLELRKVMQKTFNFFGQEITVPIIADTAYVSQVVNIANDMVGDVAILSHPALKVDFCLPTIFRGTTTWGDVLIGTRQSSPGDISW